MITRWYQWFLLLTLAGILSDSFLPPVSAQQEHQVTTHSTCENDRQCLNGGQCIDQGGMDSQQPFRQCSCDRGYNGARCENFCPLACQHGGVCRSTTTGSSTSSGQAQQYVCKCLGYFTGSFCETAYENCRDGSQCFNGGKCKEHESQSHKTSYCECPSGFGGPSCELNDPNPEQGFLIGSLKRSGNLALSIVLIIILVLFVFTVIARFVRERTNQKYKALVTSDEQQTFRNRTGQKSGEKLWMNVV